jgi:hypothetical protein
MSKEEMDARSWPYDPFNGLKILRNDMEYYFNADPDLQKTEELIEYLKSIEGALKEIMDNIKWLHQTIRNMIDWKRFVSGG